MSRIGKLPIEVPSGVSVSVSPKNRVTVKGPKGELDLAVDPDIQVGEEDGTYVVSRPTDQKRHRALHGLTRSLISNMVTGVSEGYKKELEVIGVGYRAEMSKVGSLDVLELALGFSHPIYFVPPDGITLGATSVRGQNARVTIEGIDKQLVGQTAAKIRGLRPPEPYKGKGIRYSDEFVRRKAGKTAAR
jgi:large subunit ribosomal protein L6